MLPSGAPAKVPLTLSVESLLTTRNCRPRAGELLVPARLTPRPAVVALGEAVGEAGVGAVAAAGGAAGVAVAGVGPAGRQRAIDPQGAAVDVDRAGEGVTARRGQP